MSINDDQIKITVYLPNDLYLAMRDFSSALEISHSDFIRSAVRNKIRTELPVFLKQQQNIDLQREKLRQTAVKRP